MYVMRIAICFLPDVECNKVNKQEAYSQYRNCTYALERESEASRD